MRIAILSYEYPPETGFGGIGTYSYYQAHALARLGHDVHVFAGSQSPQRRTYRDGNVTVTRWRSVGIVERLAPNASRLGLHWSQNRLQTAANSLAAVRRELQRGRFDVVEMPECGGEGALLNHMFGLPTVVRIHSPAELIMRTYPTKASDRALTSAVERLGISGARVITACSHWVAEEVRRRMGIDRPITVIPNGIDLSLFDQDQGIDAQERFSIPRDRVRIFFANRLEERKGIHVVRDLMAPVLQKHPEAQFLLAGADPSDVVARELKPALAAMGREDALLHLGKLTLPEVRACLKQSDIFLLPSLWENAPYSLLEAMSAGKPVVASDCGGVPEILRHEIDGIVVPTGNAQAFVRGLSRLIGDAKLRLRLGQSARSRIEARFTDEHVARRSLELYEWALGAPQSAPSRGHLQSSVALGPDNWFQAWWLRNSSSQERPTFDPSFREVGLAELDFAHAVSARIYWAGPARSDVAETDYLDDLATTHRVRAIEAHRTGSEPEMQRRLALPSLSHPIFDDESASGSFLDELWRLGDHPMVGDWMLREVGATDFVDRASRSVMMRRLAVDAFRRRPCESTSEALRKIYRTAATAARIVEKDREFISSHPKGSEFSALVERYGLHAPLSRTPVFPASRRRKPGKSRAGEAVTVLIPSFRHEAFVRNAIESALNQTHPDIRVLVVDDASPDRTVEAARAVSDPRLEVRANTRNLGLGGSIRAALSSVTTPYVALLNSDDVFHPERIERCMAALARDAGAALVTTGLSVMDAEGRKLTKESSCVLDVGGPAHDWVRWHARVTGSLEGGDWTSLAALLRHNHLATSSNVVCRTEFLADLAPSFEKLHYCLDWHLFFRAAIAGSLRHIPDALLGYRLHGSNTVWFDDQARPGYIHEVNAVVADALRTHAARRRAAGVAGEQIAEEIAGLLRQNALVHGETDGLALYLAEATLGLDLLPAAFRTPELSAVANEALAAKRRALPSNGGEAKTKLMRHAIDALSQRNRQLEPAVGRLQSQTSSSAQQREDSASLRATTDEAVLSASTAAATAAAVQEALDATNAQLEQTAKALVQAQQLAAANQAKAEAEKTLAGETQTRLDHMSAERAEQARAADQLRVELATARQEIERHAASARIREQSAVDTARAHEEQVRALEAQLRTIGAQLRQLQEQSARDHEALASAATQIASLREEQTTTSKELEATRSEIERVRNEAAENAAATETAHQGAVAANALWAGHALTDERRARRLLETSLEHRVGNWMLRKAWFASPARSAIGACQFLATTLDRIGGALRQRLPGRHPSRAILVWDGAYPDPDCAQAAGLVKALEEAGIDARIACSARSGQHWLSPDLEANRDRRIVVSSAQAQQRRDQSWWQSNAAQAAATVASLQSRGPAVVGAYTLARSARAWGCAYLHGFGFGNSGATCEAAAKLLGTPFGLTITRHDLGRIREPHCLRLAKEADALFVDSPELAQAVRTAAGIDLPSLVVVPPLLPAPRARGAELHGRIACAGPFSDAEGLLTLAGAVQQLVQDGDTVQLDLLGADSDEAANHVAFDWFRGRLAANGIANRVLLRPEASPAAVMRAIGEACVVFDPRTGGEHDPAGISFAGVAALAAGRPLVGFDGGMPSPLRTDESAILVARGDEAALASAIQRLMASPDLRRTVGAAGQTCYHANFSLSTAAAEACAKIKALMRTARA